MHRSHDGRATTPEASEVADTSLIDEMLRLSPAERLRQNDRMASLVATLHESFSDRKGTWPSRET